MHFNNNTTLEYPLVILCLAKKNGRIFILGNTEMWLCLIFFIRNTAVTDKNIDIIRMLKSVLIRKIE